MDAVSNYSTSRVERKTKNGDGLERIGWSGSSYRTVVVVAAFHDALSHLSLVRLSPLVCNVKKRKERERERETQWDTGKEQGDRSKLLTCCCCWWIEYITELG